MLSPWMYSEMGSGEPVKAEPVRDLEGDKTIEEEQRNGIGGALKGHAAYSRGGHLTWPPPLMR